MSYGNTHRFLLRTIASRGVLSFEETEGILTPHNGDKIEILVKEINDKIKPFKQSIKIVNDEVTSSKLLVFLSLGYDDTTKSQNVFSSVELQYFRVLIEQIMTTESRQISSIQALNLVSNLKISKTVAQTLLNTWCRMHYLDNNNSNYALGIRAIHEFENYLRENMPDTIEECSLCKQIVFRGYNCPACYKAIHTLCLNRYLEKVKKWPCCRVNYSSSQVERLISGELTQTQQLRRTQSLMKNIRLTENETMEITNDEDLEFTQPTPGTSQTIIRKRKRRDD